MSTMRLCLQTLVFVVLCATGHAILDTLKNWGSALMGDLLSTIPARLQCVGTGKNFTKFLLYSRTHPDKPRTLVPGDRELLLKSDFDPEIPTKVILHGFIDNMHMSDWMQRMKSKFLSVDDFNVIIVDWSCGNDFPYFQAVTNSKITATELTKLVVFLRDTGGADPSHFHFIGHSLGSHIAAIVGHAVPHIGRISALDPAGPRFYDAQLEERLDPGDAAFVDVIHTDSGHRLLEGLGMRSQVGHVDFYPNGGIDQPGCHDGPFSILPRIGIHRVARYYMTCDHLRAVEYYIDSIKSPFSLKSTDGATCEHVGVTCRDWETYAQGRCADCSHDGDCALMGYLSNLYLNGEIPVSKHGYYVKTSKEEPFCLYQYQVVVEAACEPGLCANSAEGVSPGEFHLELNTLGGKVSRLEVDENSDVKMKPGGQYVFLASSRFPVGGVHNAKVWWGNAAKPTYAASSPLQPNTLRLKRIEVFPIQFTDKVKRLSNPAVTVLCSNNDMTIEKNKYIELVANECH